ncbi:uncharacterized protein LOC100208776 [Hydra vulgaris]|uniref:uncharacterized protein LOC100208776 n=1 Tax=Hydra vulgaris TaxID=6087 RepID=UPI001F5E4F7F|nr:uncharacterized protein LOC100208776 [Hydra vulgaris]
MNSNTLSLAVTSGIAALVGSLAIWKIKSGYASLANSKEKDFSEIVHDLKVESIATLLKSSDFKIRQSAEQLLMERSARKLNLMYILKQCIQNDIKKVVKAVTAIHLLVKSSEHAKGLLIDLQAIETLTKTIENISKSFDYNYLVQECKKNYVVEKVMTHCMASLFYLLLHSPTALAEFSKEKNCIKEIFVNILGDHSFCIPKEVRRWSTYILYQLVQQDMSIKSSLRQWGIIRKVTRCIIVTSGDILQIQLCLQIIVQYLNDNVEEMVQICKEMASLGIISHLVGLLRSDDDENIVQLSAILIHNFCCFDVDIVNLVQIPGFVKILYAVLNSSDHGTQHTILRICNYLSVGNNKFCTTLLEHKPLIKKLSVFMCSSSSEVMSSSLMLVHDLLMSDKSFIPKLVKVNPEIIKSLVKLSFTCENDTVQLIAETLGYLCSCESLHSLMLEYGVVNSILHFAKSGDVGVQFWSSALLLNISMLSDQMKETIIQNGGINILLEMAVSIDEVDLPDIAINATKTLVSLGYLDLSLNVKLTCGLESSIVINEKEYCPGKQGINLISLDFLNYKYSKGLVIQPSELEAYLNANMDSLKKSDSLFIVTQGDCTVLEQGGMPSIVYQLFMKSKDVSFLYSPAWCLVLTCHHCEVVHGVQNITKHMLLPLGELVSAILQENFTMPLIDVLLAVPTTTTLCKTEELKQVEILARNSFQRRVIVTSASFLGYLSELIWNVADGKFKGLSEPRHQILVAHCAAALKILHLCSIDTVSTNDLFSCGLVNPLVALIVSLIPGLMNKIQITKPIDEKPALGKFEESLKGISEQKKYFDFEFDESENKSFISSDEESLLEGVTNDDIFLPGNLNDYKKQSITYGKENHQKRISRLRSDSYILRNQSLLDPQNYGVHNEPSVFFEESENEQRVITSHGRTFSISATHQQMRRISRTLSATLQQTKSEESSPQLNDPNEVLKELTKQTIAIIYHMIKNGSKEICLEICSTHILSILYCLVGCFAGNFQKSIGLTLSSMMLHTSKTLGNVSEPLIDFNVSMERLASHHTSIISSDGLQITNENWFFETVCANQYICRSLYSDEYSPLGWYYEVTVLTDGIMQIGWMNDKCLFSPEKGIGVGDDMESCGFDGARCKIWDGPSRDSHGSNDYGIEWQTEDVISVLLTWNGIVSFWINGKDMGPISKKLDLDGKWYPAASLSANQCCTFAFDEEDFRHSKPNGFHSLAELKRKINGFCKPNVILNPTFESLPSIIFKDSVQLVYYFEVNLSNYLSLKDFTIGYLCSAVQPLVSCNRTFVYYGGNVFGCGLLLPYMELVFTCNGQIIFRDPVKFDFAEESFLKLLPFVSIKKVKLNLGQHTFAYKEANSMLYKQGYLHAVYNIMTILDGVS